MKEHLDFEDLDNLNGVPEEIFPRRAGSYFKHPETDYVEVVPSPDPSGFEYNEVYLQEGQILPNITHLINFIETQEQKSNGMWKIIHTADNRWYIHSNNFQYSGETQFATRKHEELIYALWEATLFIVKNVYEHNNTNT